MAEEKILKIDRVTRKFGDFTAVKKVSFQVNRGEIFALLGPNGAGKTTTMKMITGTLKPTEGNIKLNEYDSFNERDKCMALTGYVPDEPAFPAYVRAGELIFFYGEIHGLTKSEIEERSIPLIKRLEIADSLNEFAVNYSKGMKKKLALVLALLHQPELLVLDELTNGLDPYATRELHKMMYEHRESGTAILFSTHLLDQAEKLCDRVAIVKKGEIAVSGMLDEIRDGNSNLEELFFKHTEQLPEKSDDESDCGKDMSDTNFESTEK